VGNFVEVDLTPEMTPEEAKRFTHLAHTVTAMVGNMQPRPAPQLAKPAIGSGVLARVGGVDFMITAGHNLENCEEKELFFVTPHGHGLLSLLAPGRLLKSVVRPNAGEADIAVIELDPEQAGLWRNSEPITVDEFGLHEAVQPTDRVIVCGCPYADVKELAPVNSLLVGGEAKPAFSVLAVPYVTRIAHEFHPGSDADWSRGRGFYVYYVESVFEDGQVAFVHPEGISGGAVVAIEGGQRTLLGFARSFLPRRAPPHNDLNDYELCEPSWCALEFLRDCHPNLAVKADASRGLKRLGRG
jgi:hypothetical protein